MSIFAGALLLALSPAWGQSVRSTVGLNPVISSLTVTNIPTGSVVVSTCPAGANCGTLTGDPTKLFLNFQTGNVGIRTNNPATLLHMSSGTLTLDGNVQPMLTLNGSGGATNPQILFKELGAIKAYIYEANGASSLYINSDGVATSGFILNTGTNFIGIGAGTPATKLHMSSGVFTVDGTAAGVNLGANAPLTVSSATFVGVAVSTQTAGAAGAAVTATCFTAGTFAIGGGCDCASAVAITEVKSVPNCVTQGCIPTGWTCQEPGGTGGQCSAYVICSRLQ